MDGIKKTRVAFPDISTEVNEKNQIKWKPLRNRIELSWRIEYKFRCFFQKIVFIDCDALRVILTDWAFLFSYLLY